MNFKFSPFEKVALPAWMRHWDTLGGTAKRRLARLAETNVPRVEGIMGSTSRGSDAGLREIRGNMWRRGAGHNLATEDKLIEHRMARDPGLIELDAPGRDLFAYNMKVPFVRESAGEVITPQAIGSTLGPGLESQLGMKVKRLHPDVGQHIMDDKSVTMLGGKTMENPTMRKATYLHEGAEAAIPDNPLGKEYTKKVTEVAESALQRGEDASAAAREWVAKNPAPDVGMIGSHKGVTPLLTEYAYSAPRGVVYRGKGSPSYALSKEPGMEDIYKQYGIDPQRAQSISGGGRMAHRIEAPIRARYDDYMARTGLKQSHALLGSFTDELTKIAYESFEEEEQYHHPGQLSLNEGEEEAIRHYLETNPHTSDEEFHEFLDELGIDHDEGEEIAYELAHQGARLEQQEDEKGFRPDSEYDPHELHLGIKEEMEHFQDEELAKEIAKDHLDEDHLYYSHMEELKQSHGYFGGNIAHSSAEQE